jgi:hypothetical protein
MHATLTSKTGPHTINAEFGPALRLLGRHALAVQALTGVRKANLEGGMLKLPQKSS